MESIDRKLAVKRLDNLAEILQIHPFIDSLLNVAKQLKAEPYLVGGVLRDAILGRPSADLDLAVRQDAIEFATILAEEAGGTFVLLDDIHGSARVVFDDDTSIDITDFRASSIENDCIDRDLTCNALAAPLAPFLKQGHKVVLDPAKGMDDILRGVIRTRSEKILVDDPLRILRAFRYAATLGFAILPETREMIRSHANGLQDVAAERVLNEIRLIFRSKKAGDVLPSMLRSGTLAALFDFFSPPELSAWVGRATYIEKAMDKKPPLPGIEATFADPRGFRLVTMLAASLPGPRITDLIVRLRLSRRITGRVMRIGMTMVSVNRLVNEHPIEEDFLFISARILLALREDRPAPWLILASEEDEDKVFRVMERAEKVIVDKVLPVADAPPLVTGAELMETFDRAPGPWITEMLDRIFFERLTERVNDKDTALAYAERLIQEGFK